MILVTIIIPIHNSEIYLEECVESALSQSFQELEILCIDGGSTDRSGEILKKLQSIDNRVIVMEDTNTSYGHKINLGIDKARGKYIAILESDDIMNSKMIEILYGIAEKYNTDIADSNYCEFITFRNKILYNTVHKYRDSVSYDHFIKYNDSNNRDIAMSGIWTGLYKKSFIKEQKIRLNESSGASYQDLSFLFLTSFFAVRVYHVNMPLYQYRVDNPKSSVKDDHKIFEIITECEFLKNNLILRNIVCKEKWDLYYIRKYNAFYWNYCRLSKESREIFLEKYLEELKNDLGRCVIERKTFDSSLYDRTFLLLDDKEEFIRKTDSKPIQPFMTRVARELEKIDGQDVILVGIGRSGIKLIDILLQNGNHIRAICDNSQKQQGILIHGFKIISVHQAIKEFAGDKFFITSYKYRKEMVRQLLDGGIKMSNILVLE